MSTECSKVTDGADKTLYQIDRKLSWSIGVRRGRRSRRPRNAPRGSGENICRRGAVFELIAHRCLVLPHRLAQVPSQLRRGCSSLVTCAARTKWGFLDAVKDWFYSLNIFARHLSPLHQTGGCGPIIVVGPADQHQSYQAVKAVHIRILTGLFSSRDSLQGSMPTW